MQVVLARWTSGCRSFTVAHRWRWIWPYGGLVLVLCLVLWPAWISGDRLIVGGDTTLIHYPYFVLWRDSISAGEFPFWNPYTFSGIPAFPTLQAGYGYPPHWLFSGIAAIPAMNWLIGLHVVLAGLGAAWCAGRLGATASGQFLSGLAYALGSAMVARMWAGHFSFVESNAWLPWATGLAIQIERRGAVVYLALAVALMILAGQPELLIMSAWWLPLWAAGSASGGGWSRAPRALLRCGLGIGLGVGLAAFQLLPAVELLAVSNRRAEMGWDFMTGISLPPWHLLEAVAPLLFGDPQSSYWPGPAYEWHERLLYVGIVPLLAAARSSGRQRWLCLGATALAVALAFGRYLPGYSWTQLFPGYSSFRVPSKHLTLAALALALAGGLGLSRLQGRPVAFAALLIAVLLAGATSTLGIWLPGAAALLGGTDLPGLTGVGGSEVAAAALSGLRLPLAVLTGIALVALLPPRWCQRGLLLLATIDLVFTLQPFRLRSVNPLDMIANAGSLRDQTRAAVVGNGGALLANFGPVLRVVQPVGFVSLFSAEYMTLFTGGANASVAMDVPRGDNPALRLLGYAIIIDPEKHLVTVVEPAPPRAWIAHCVWPGTAIQVRDADFPRESCITRRTATVRDEEVPPGPATIVAEGSGWLRVEADGPGWLVAAQPWYPGWSGQVDGAPVAVEAVDGALVGLPVPPGSHLINLRYLPAGLLPGLLISALSGLLLLLAWLGDRSWPKKRQMGSER